MQLFKNNAYSTLAAALTTASTSMSVAAGHGDRFPAVTGSNFVKVTLHDEANNIEIIKITARVPGSDAMTIARAQEGTTARAWSIGTIVEARITAEALTPLGVLNGAATADEVRDSIDSPSKGGAGATGTWGIDVSGNAGTATKLETARKINGVDFNGESAITVEPYVERDDTTNSSRFIAFVDSSSPGHQRLNMDINLEYNPSTNTLAANILGMAGSVANGVYTVGNQTINGIKTFGSSPVVPAGTLDGHAVNRAQMLVEIQAAIQNAINSIFPTGFMGLFGGWNPPAGWLVMRSDHSIGKAGSGATHSGDENWPLFLHLWWNSDNADVPILTSGGAVTGRGASPDADWAANKRMSLPEGRGEFFRGMDLGRGIEPGRRPFQLILDAFQAHQHNYDDFQNGGGGGYAGAGSVNAMRTTSGIAQAAGYSVPRIADETRPRSTAGLPVIRR